MHRQCSNSQSFLETFVIVALLFLVIVNNLFSELQFVGSMFADAANVSGKTVNLFIIQSDPLKMADWAAEMTWL